MKKIYTLFLALIITGTLMAQAPQSFNYQAIVRGSGGSLIVNSQVGIKISILQGSISGTAVCIEEFTPTTNDYGLVTLEIGSVNSLDFELIDWSDGPYFIKIELDENGDALYDEMGTSQLLSVPYALHANTASRTTGDSIWKKSTDDIYFSGGNVGIGTSNPLGDLHISDTLTTTSNSMIYLGTKNAKFRMMAYESSPSSWIQAGSEWVAGSTSDLGFSGMFGTPFHMILKSSGRLGIGTENPEAVLDVNGTTIVRGNFLTGSPNIEINAYGSGNRYSYIDFHSDNTWDDYALRIIRYNTGPDAISKLYHHGTGPFQFVTGDWAPIDFYTAGTHRMKIHPNGNVGIGTTDPTSRLQVETSETWNDETPLFEVKNKDGIPVFAVFNNGVRILVEDDLAKGPKGGFSIGGFDRNKGYAETYDFMRITPDTIRFLINNDDSKGPKGGFSIGGFDRNKGLVEDFMNLTPTYSSYGAYNTLLGYNAGQNNSGNYNVFIGYSSGKNNTSGTANVLIGYESGRNNLGGSNNVFIGNQCGYYNTSGSYNTFLGYKAGLHNEEGTANVFLGQSSGSANRSGHNNVFLGFEAGRSNLTGDDNVFIGRQSGLSATEGSRNVFIGYQSGVNNLSGVDNSIIGHQAGYYNTTGTHNAFFGYKAGLHNTTALYNVFIGSGSGSANRTGGGNLYVGFEAGRSNLSGSYNVFIGRQAGLNELGSEKLYIDNNGTTTPLIWGDFSQDILRFNGYIMQDSPQAAYDLWIQGGTAGFTGGDNRNLAFLGLSESYGDQLIINYDGEYAGGTIFNGKVGIGTSPATKLAIAGLTGTTSGSYLRIYNNNVYYYSSSRDTKKDIIPLEENFSKILKAQPVSFTDKVSGERNIGFIAEDFDELGLSHLIVFENSKPKSINYELVSIYNLEIIKEQQQQIEELKSRNNEIDDLKAQIEELQQMMGVMGKD